VLHVVFAAAATAQTVIVTHAPPGDKIDVILAGKPAGSGTADSAGVATVSTDMRAAVGGAQMDARVYVDVCSKLHRVIIMERNQLPAAKEDGCDRREISGIFWVRPSNTLVINVGGPIPTMLLTRGKYDVNNPAPLKRAPLGLVLFGGGGLINFSDFGVAACGSVTDCTPDNSGGALTAGAAYWILPWLAAEGSYIRPSTLTTTGAGSNFDFNTVLDAHLLTVAGNVAIPIRAVRLYGKIGANFHRATTTTTQSSNSVTQIIELDTEGWGTLFGAGFEGWIKPAFAIYLDGAFGSMKGKSRSQMVEGDIDQGFKYAVAGIRVRLF
jgi:hypothetical protein